MHQQDLPAQKRAFLVDFEKLKTVAAFRDDIHAAIVIFLCDRKNFRGATHVGEVRLLGANHAELLFLLQALSDHLLVPRLEDVQGSGVPGNRTTSSGNNASRESKQPPRQASTNNNAFAPIVQPLLDLPAGSD